MRHRPEKSAPSRRSGAKFVAVDDRPMSGCARAGGDGRQLGLMLVTTCAAPGFHGVGPHHALVLESSAGIDAFRGAEGLKETPNLPKRSDARSEPDSAERCEIDSGWTLWDGFQTLQNPWKPLQNKACRVRDDVRRSARNACDRPQPHLTRSLRRMGDGIQTPVRGQFSDD